MKRPFSTEASAGKFVAVGAGMPACFRMMEPSETTASAFLSLTTTSAICVPFTSAPSGTVTRTFWSGPAVTGTSTVVPSFQVTIIW